MDNRTYREELQDFDPLGVAEEILGKGENADALGFLLLQKKSQQESLFQTLHDDTKFSNTLERYVRIITSMGFELVLDEIFDGRSRHKDTAPEQHLYIYANREKGWVLSFDTFTGFDRESSVNGGKVYYVWKPKDWAGKYRYTSSGRMDCERSGWREEWDRVQDETENVPWTKTVPADVYWKGDHDCRANLRMNLDRLDKNGTFLAPWPKDKCPFGLFHHWMDYQETHGRNLKNERARRESEIERYQRTPDWFKTLVNFSNL